MCDKLLHREYKKLISFLNKNNFHYKRDYDELCYVNENFIISITRNDVNIQTLIDSRRYIFTNESSEFLIEILDYLFTSNVYE